MAAGLLEGSVELTPSQSDVENDPSDGRFVAGIWYYENKGTEFRHHEIVLCDDPGAFSLRKWLDDGLTRDALPRSDLRLPTQTCHNDEHRADGSLTETIGRSSLGDAFYCRVDRLPFDNGF